MILPVAANAQPPPVLETLSDSPGTSSSSSEPSSFKLQPPEKLPITSLALPSSRRAGSRQRRKPDSTALHPVYRLSTLSRIFSFYWPQLYDFLK
jgi:hypothetical protein